MATDSLHDLSPGEALDMYIKDRGTELTENSLKTYRTRIKAFVEWCQATEIDSLADIDGLDIHRWKAEMDVEPVTVANRLQAVRRFVKWAASLDATDPDLWEKIEIPTVNASRTVHLDSETAEQVLSYLDRFEYASRNHVTVLLIWRTAMRLGSLRALDVDDYQPTEGYLELRHRPESGTPLKNGTSAERSVSLSPETCRVVDDYLSHNRLDVSDDSGREPFLTTPYGRVGETAIQRTTWAATRPCQYAGECPHDRDPAECPAARNKDRASKCPDSLSPHPVRRGAITHHLRKDVPKLVVSERTNVSPDILDAHYNQLTEQEQMQRRRKYLDDL